MHYPVSDSGKNHKAYTYVVGSIHLALRGALMNKKYRNPSTEVFLFVILFVTSLFEVPYQALAREPELNFDSICPRHRRLRTPQEVLEDHVAAFVSGDEALVACDYARDAVFIQPDA